MTIQAILSRFLTDYKQHYTLKPTQDKVVRHLRQCRTAALGGQFVQCEQCGFEQQRYHSCRNRHCPQCQGKATQQWCDQQLEKVLPVTYYHVVFTLPHELNPWVSCHPEVIYRCLFQAVWQTIKTFGADQKRLGGEMGMTAVLHTWGQNLIRHVHLHCLIPGGALAHDQWHAARSTYLFPVTALSRHFRGCMVSALRQAQRQGELYRLASSQIDDDLNQLMSKDWVVYSKTHLSQAQRVVRYLARYTHKIAISESRIDHIDDQQVVFDYKDYRDDKDKQMSLGGVEFVRRFLLHVLPPGFMRIRHYGFLANRVRRQRLSLIRSLLEKPVDTHEGHDRAKTTVTISIPIVCPCPKCHKGDLRVRYEIPAVRCCYRH